VEYAEELLDLSDSGALGRHRHAAARRHCWTRRFNAMVPIYCDTPIWNRAYGATSLRSARSRRKSDSCRLILSNVPRPRCRPTLYARASKYFSRRALRSVVSPSLLSIRRISRADAPITAAVENFAGKRGVRHDGVGHGRFLLRSSRTGAGRCPSLSFSSRGATRRARLASFAGGPAPFVRGGWPTGERLSSRV